MHIRWKQSSAFKQLLEALLLVIKMCTSFTKDVIWVNTKVSSVTSEPTQNSSRCILSFNPFKTAKGLLSYV